MGLKLANNASSILAAAISASDTTISIQPSDANKFPTLLDNDWFPLTVVDAAGNMEIMRVTARTGSVFTVTRGREETTAKAFSVGSRADLRLTVEAIYAAQQVLSVAGKGNHVILGIQDVEMLEGVLNSIDTQIGIFTTNFSRIDLTKDSDKPVSNAQQSAIDQKLGKTETANNSASLGGKAADAWQNDVNRINWAVNDTRFAGYVEGAFDHGDGVEWSSFDMNWAGYVLCRVFKPGRGWFVTYAFRQPQIHIPSVGWRALGGW